jgi:hypothetical protein
VISKEEDLFLNAKAIDKSVPPAQWVDTSFGEKAKTEVG